MRSLLTSTQVGCERPFTPVVGTTSFLNLLPEPEASPSAKTMYSAARPLVLSTPLPNSAAKRPLFIRAICPGCLVKMLVVGSEIM